MTTKEEMEKVLHANRLVAAKAIEKMGGVAKAAQQLSTEDRPLKTGHVWAWLNRDKRGIPLEYLKAIERVSGVAREEMRQDIPWRS